MAALLYPSALAETERGSLCGGLGEAEKHTGVMLMGGGAAWLSLVEAARLGREFGQKGV